MEGHILQKGEERLGGGVEGGDCTNSYSSINRYHGNDYNLLSYQCDS